MRKTYGENIADLKEKGSDGDGQKGDSYTHACASFLRLCCINGVFVSTAYDRQKQRDVPDDRVPFPEWFRRSAESVPALENARTIYTLVYFPG